MLPSMGKDPLESIASPANASSEFICALCMILSCPINAEEFLRGAKVLPELPVSGSFCTDSFVGKLSQFVSGRKFRSSISNTRQRFTK